MRRDEHVIGVTLVKADLASCCALVWSASRSSSGVVTGSHEQFHLPVACLPCSLEPGGARVDQLPGPVRRTLRSRASSATWRWCSSPTLTSVPWTWGQPSPSTRPPRACAMPWPVGMPAFRPLRRPSISSPSGPCCRCWAPPGVSSSRPMGSSTSFPSRPSTMTASSSSTPSTSPTSPPARTCCLAPRPSPLLELPTPGVLHLATHGFFLGDAPTSQASRAVGDFGALGGGVPGPLPADP